MTALLLLSHQPATCVNRMVAHWRERTRPGHIVVAYGGPREEFDAIQGHKAFIDDPRLRTRDHQREKQSYHRVIESAVQVLAGEVWDTLYLAEFDMLPVAEDLWDRLRGRLDREKADLLGYRAWRIDGTLHPHYAHHVADSSWLKWLRAISVREDPSVILNCMGCGQFWRREAIEAVASAGEAVPAYLELQLPTVAHHLGFRVRGMGDQDPFVIPNEVGPEALLRMKEQGAWVIHPDKTAWSDAAGSRLGVKRPA